MNDMIQLNREALREFVKLMAQMTDDLKNVRAFITPSYAGTEGGHGEADPAYRGGVKVTLGAVDYSHPGRIAGEIMADRIAASLNFAIGLEEGTRALGSIVQAILNDMNNQDQISQARLTEIHNSIGTGQANNPYGIPPGLVPRLLGKFDDNLPNIFGK